MKRNQLPLSRPPPPLLPINITAPRTREPLPPGVEVVELLCAAFRFTTEIGGRASSFAVWVSGTGIRVSASRIRSHAGFPADVAVAAFVAAAVGADLDAAHGRVCGGWVRVLSEDDGSIGTTAGLGYWCLDYTGCLAEYIVRWSEQRCL